MSDRFDWQTDLVVAHIKRARRFLSDAAIAQGFELDRWAGIESPAEGVFAVWWRAIEWVMRAPLRATAQVPLLDGRYRADFLIVCTDRWLLEAAAAERLVWRPIVVEVDGHTFHERTREQVTDRNQRDRDLQDAGCIVSHVSFEELTTEPERTVGELYSGAQDQLRRLQLALEDARPR